MVVISRPTLVVSIRMLTLSEITTRSVPRISQRRIDTSLKHVSVDYIVTIP